MSSSSLDLTFEILDKWCEQLFDCQPLSEQQVKQLCDKVRTISSALS